MHATVIKHQRKEPALAGTSTIINNTEADASVALFNQLELMLADLREISGRFATATLPLSSTFVPVIQVVHL